MLAGRVAKQSQKMESHPSGPAAIAAYADLAGALKDCDVPCRTQGELRGA